jgi:PIN domain nuclease of toxin-antitoxin system
MRALLDTSVFLWMIAGSERLGVNARSYISDLNNGLLLSVASLWEIAIKCSLGKLELTRPYDQLIPEQLEKNSIDVLSIEVVHLSEIVQLPFYHRDPFDRLIIAQGISEGFPIISNDSAFQNYPVDLIW